MFSTTATAATNSTSHTRAPASVGVVSATSLEDSSSRMTTKAASAGGLPQNIETERNGGGGGHWLSLTNRRLFFPSTAATSLSVASSRSNHSSPTHHHQQQHKNLLLNHSIPSQIVATGCTASIGIIDRLRTSRASVPSFPPPVSVSNPLTRKKYSSTKEPPRGNRRCSHAMLPSPVLSQRSWHPPAAVPGTTKSPSKNDRGSSASPSAILCWNLKHLASEEDYDYFDENNTSAVSSPSSLAADVNGFDNHPPPSFPFAADAIQPQNKNDGDGVPLKPAKFPLVADKVVDDDSSAAAVIGSTTVGAPKKKSSVVGSVSDSKARVSAISSTNDVSSAASKAEGPTDDGGLLNNTVRRVASFSFTAAATTDPDANEEGIVKQRGECGVAASTMTAKRSSGSSSNGVAVAAIPAYQHVKTSAKFTLGPIGKTVKKTLKGLRLKKDIASASTSLLYPTKEEVRRWQHSFVDLLNHKYGCMLFRKFIASEHSDENLEFWQLCEEFKLLATRGGRRRSESSGGGDVPPPHHDDQQQGGQAEGGTSLLVVDEEEQELRAKARRIFNEYIANGAEKEVNLDSGTKHGTREALSRCGIFSAPNTPATPLEASSRGPSPTPTDEHHPSHSHFHAQLRPTPSQQRCSSPNQQAASLFFDPNIFVPAQMRIEQLMEKDSYQRFLKTDVYLELLNDASGGDGQHSHSNNSLLLAHSAQSSPHHHHLRLFGSSSPLGLSPIAAEKPPLKDGGLGSTANVITRTSSVRLHH